MTVLRSLPSARISRLAIQGFRSFEDVCIEELPALAVLIGANGSGKSNLIHFFEMLSWMLKTRQLALFVAKHGGGSDQLFGGSSRTTRIKAALRIETEQGMNDYKFALEYSDADRLIFTEERFRFSRRGWPTEAPWQFLPPGDREAAVLDVAHSEMGTGVNKTTARTIVGLLRNCAHYQFHNTSATSSFRKKWDVHDNARLRSDGGNLAAVLYRLRDEDLRRYEYICRQIARVLPVFETFEIEQEYGKVLLRWRARDTGQTIGAHLTSDGSLRFFALATLLNLPPEALPSVILLDEPELGLHPSAVDLAARMIRGLGSTRQVVVATQSPLLVDAFDAENVIVVETDGSRSTLKAIDTRGPAWEEWLEEYTVGQLWEKNLIGGRP
ncbi:MAG: AAA family ATPase [Bryobacterales bacterium]|nr:AAA family ATPase [Bryobacterales bacterium]